MTAHLEEVVAAIGEGKCLVVVQDDDVQEYAARFLTEDPGGMDPPRPVLTWDSADSFVPCSEYPEELPETDDLATALEFVRDYRGNAVFIIDSRRLEIDTEGSRPRKVLRQLQLRVSGVVAVVITSRPIAPSLAEQVTWIGPPPQDPEEAPSAAEQAPTVRASRQAYRDLHRIEDFDTPQWEERLERMKPDEVEQVVASGAHLPVLDRLNTLRDTLKKRFAEKDTIIDAICAAAVAQVPTVLIGPPGTAKSNLIRCFCEGLGLSSQHASNGSPSGRKYFEYLLTRYSTPEEIFGPVHVQDLIERQVYRRVTAGYLPEAQIAFLDEIFKASSAILNALLTILNERLFYNAGIAVRVPLLMVFAASNKAPTDESLQALYDRFPLRINCAAVADAQVGDMLTASWTQAYDRQFSAENLAVPRCACSNDLRLLYHVMRVKYGNRSTDARGATMDFCDEFLRFFRSLRHDFGISDRTAAHLFAYCRAHALIEQHDEMGSDELDVFRYITWDEAGTDELARVVSNMKRGIRL